MLILTSSQAVHHTIAHCTLKLPIQTLNRYAALIDTEPIAWLYIIQPGDSAEDLATTRQRPFECWEFIVADSGWFEAVFAVSDDGFGHAVLIPDQAEIDGTLLTICRNHAEQAEGQ